MSWVLVDSVLLHSNIKSDSTNLWSTRISVTQSTGCCWERTHRFITSIFCPPTQAQISMTLSTLSPRAQFRLILQSHRHAAVDAEHLRSSRAQLCQQSTTTTTTYREWKEKVEGKLQGSAFYRKAVGPTYSKWYFRVFQVSRFSRFHCILIISGNYFSENKNLNENALICFQIKQLSIKHITQCAYVSLKFMKFYFGSSTFDPQQQNI